MDETIDDFKANAKLIKEEKKMKLAMISKYLSPSHSQSQQSTFSSQSQSSSSKDSASDSPTFDSKPKSSKFTNLNESVAVKSKSTSTTNLSKKKSSKTTSNSKDHISKYFSSSRVNEADVSVDVKKEITSFSCPICSLDLSLSDEADRQKHVNRCLDNEFSYKQSANKFKLKKPSDENIDETRTKKAKIEVDTSQAASTSPVTKLPPSTKSVQQQSDDEQQNRIQKSGQTLLKDIVPNCPICGKVLHSLNIRQNHLKKCAQLFHIKTESLFELIKKQQEKLEADLAKGLIPSDVYKEDEKLHIAIALSNSLNPTEDCSKPADVKVAKSSTRSNKKQLNTQTALLLTDEGARISIVSKKLSDILSNQVNYSNQNLAKQINRPLKQTKFSSVNNYLWNKCKYFLESDENFYVKLFLDSGKFLIGKQLFVEKANEEQFLNVEIVNTQTAFLLADLNDQTQESVSIYYTQQQERASESCLINLPSQLQQTFNYELDESDHKSDINDQVAEKLVEKNETQLENISYPNETKLDALDDSSTINDKTLTQEENIEMPLANDSPQETTHPTSSTTESSGKPSKLTQILLETSNSSSSCDVVLTSDTEVICEDDETSNISSKQCFLIDETVMSSNSLDLSSNSDLNSGSSCKTDFKSDNISVNTSATSNLLEANITDASSLSCEVLEMNIVSANTSNNSNKTLNEDLSVSLEENNTTKCKVGGIETPSVSSSSKQITRRLSFKRKSIDIISVDDDEDKSDAKKVKELEYAKKFKPDLEVLSSDSNNSSINEAKHKENDIQIDEEDEDDQDILVALDKTEREILSQKPSATSQSETCDPLAGKANFEVLSSDSNNSIIYEIKNNDSGKKNLVDGEKEDDPDILIALGKTEREILGQKLSASINCQSEVYDQGQHYDDLDDVWNNFGENDYGDCIQYIPDDNINENNINHEFSFSKAIKTPLKTSKSPFKQPTVLTEQKFEDDEVEASPMKLHKSSSEEELSVNRNKPVEKLKPSIAKSKSSLNTLDHPTNQLHKTPITNFTKTLPPQCANATGTPLTPMPNYTDMNTPLLKDNLRKFGIKMLPKKQAVKKLVEIYQYTHRSKLQRSQSFAGFNEVNLLANADQANKKTKKTTNEKAKTSPTRNLLKKTTSEICLSKNQDDDDNDRMSQQAPAKSLIKIGIGNKSKKTQQPKLSNKQQAHLQECTLDDQLLEMVAEELSNDSDDSNDESDEGKAKQKKVKTLTQKTAKQKKYLDEDELKQFVHDLIKNDPNLHLSILNYEPLVYDEFCVQLQNALNPRKFNNKELMKVLDEFCVTFTLKNLSTRGGANAKYKSKKKN